MLGALAFAGVMIAHSASPSLPNWLAPYPGAQLRVATASGVVQASYTADATEEQVISHLRGAFSAAGVPFHPQADGIGTSIRAKTEECSLLISVREAEGKTNVRMACAALPPAPSTPVSAAASNRQEAIASMPGSPNAGGTAPALTWPPWLVPVGSAGPIQPVERVAYGEAYLEARYGTNVSLSDLYDSYSRAVEANGFRIVARRVTTRQTVKGNLVSGEPEGAVEACRSESGRSTGPRQCVKASFSGDPQKGAIRVQLVVRILGGLGNR